MNKKFMKTFGTMAIALTFCLTMLFISSTSFAQQCVDNGDRTVTDNGTGLMWQKATAGPMNWHSAMSYASRLSMGGHSGWRLPSRDELANLYHSPCKSMMEVVSSYYWSSTTHAYGTGGAWLVGFHDGYVYGFCKSNSYYVRAVRAGQ